MTGTALPVAADLADYLLDPDNGFEGDYPVAFGTGAVTLDSYVRFDHMATHGKLCVEIHADGSVVLTRFGRPYWRVIFESPGNRIAPSPVQASVIVATIRAAVEEG